MFSITAAMFKWIGQDLHVSQILFIRQLVMLLAVMPLIIRNFPEVLKTRSPSLQSARIFFTLIAMTCGFTAVVNLPLAQVTSLTFSKTFFLTIFAIIFLNETVGARRWGAIIAGFVGVLVMILPGNDLGNFDIYAGLAIISAAAMGLVAIILRKLTQVDSPVTILTYQAVAIALIMAIPAHHYWVAPDLNHWTLLVVLGILTTLAQTTMLRAFKVGEPTAIASLDYIRLLFATAWGVVIFGEWPDRYTYMGAAIIICASLYVVHREAKMGRAIARSPNGRGSTQI